MFNQQIKQHLEAFIVQYTRQTKASKLYNQSYRSVFADVPNSLGGKNFNFLLKEMYYPIVIKRSLGSRVWDIDDNEYIDLRMGLGSHLFGYNPPFIQQAIAEQLEKGIHVGLQPDVVAEVAKLICHLTGMERVTFSNTGTEAVMTAVRLARAVTSRNKIAVFSGSYHGHFDGVLVKAQMINGYSHPIPLAPGVSPSIVKDILVLDYADWRSLEEIKAHEDELAAVLVVPVQNYKPALQPKAFLQELRKLTTELGITLIFDEMATGFRIHPGGAQAYFGVQADIATYGKIIGGGLPIGVIAGKAMYMDAVDGGMWNYGDDSYPRAVTTFVAGTFCKHPLAIAAAHAVLTHLKANGSSLQEQLNQRTTEFVTTLNNYLRENGVPIKLENFGSAFVFSYSGQLMTETEKLGMELFRYHLLARKIHLVGTCSYLSTSHTDEDIDYIIKAVKDSINELRQVGFFPLPSCSLLADFKSFIGVND